MRAGIIVVFLLFRVSVSLVWAEPDEIDKKGCRDCHRFSSEGKQTKEGPDLFPSSFITNLSAPSDYFGPSFVFGPDTEEEEGGEGEY